MSRGLNEMLGTTPSTAEVMEVDTSFLDAYRRGGNEGLKRAQAHDAQPQTDAASVPGDALQPEPRRGSGSQVTMTPLPWHPDDDSPREKDAEPQLEPGPEPERGDTARSVDSRQHGGATGTAGSSGATVMNRPPPGATADTAPGAPGAPGAPENHVSATAPTLPPAAANGDPTPASLRHTDHQEAVQNSTTAKGGTGGADDTAVLPQSGFRLGGVKSQPHIKSIPEPIMTALREELRSAAVRELAVSDTAARDFSDRLSQGTLVMAFLLAQLDLHLDVDPATGRAAQLFRSSDPLLGSVAARLDSLESLETERTGLLQALNSKLAEVRQTSTVVEQAVAYLIADRTENFLRGSHDIRDAPITHKDAVYVRDKAREATDKLTRWEHERDGRPIR